MIGSTRPRKYIAEPRITTMNLVFLSKIFLRVNCSTLVMKLKC